MKYLLAKVWGAVAPYLAGELKDWALNKVDAYKAGLVFKADANAINSIREKIDAIEAEIKIEVDIVIVNKLLAEIKDLENELRKASRDTVTGAVL